MRSEELSFTDDALLKIIRIHCEGGVRHLGAEIGKRRAKW